MMPSCFSYGYLSTAEDRADETLTYVQCQVTAGFGQMFPYPPEVMAKATATATDHDTPSDEPSLEVQPTDKDSGGTSTGAIIGVVVGIIALIILGILAAWLIVRRRRQKARSERRAAAVDMAGARAHNDDKEFGGGGTYQQQQKQQEPKNRPGLGAGRLRPLSTIQEQQPSPIVSPLSAGAATTSLRDKRKSARRSQGPSWPLGSGNPLAAHPVSHNATVFMSL